MANIAQRAALLRQLHVLNRHFIDHLFESEIRCDFLPQLRSLTAAQLQAICASSFTLYELPFADDAFSARRELLVRSPCLVTGKARDLAAMTLFLAWHAAHKEPMSARLCFGMSQRTFEFFQSADVATLAAMSDAIAPALRPRWPDNPHFWPDLIRYAVSDPVRLQATRLLGEQLVAAELSSRHLPQPRLRKPPTVRTRCNEAVQQQVEPDPPNPLALLANPV